MMAGGLPYRFELNIWNIETGKRSGYSSQTNPQMRILGPHEFNIPADPIASESGRIIDLLTEQTLLELPSDTALRATLTCEVSPSHRYVIVHQHTKLPWQRLRTFLAQWDVFQSVLQGRGQLLIYSTSDASQSKGCLIGSLRLSMSQQSPGYGSSTVTKLSPDERTLVTHDPAAKSVEVWDIPLSSAILKPFLWSVLAPLTMCVWKWRRRT